LEYAIERNDIAAVFRYADNAQPYCPEKLEIYYYKGFSSYMLGHKHESVAIYKEGLEKCSDDTSPEILSTVYSILGDTYHELDMMDECMQAYDSALVYDAENVGVLNNYAYFLALDNNDLDRALEMIRKAVSLKQDDVMFLDTYAWVLFKLERYEEAKAYAEKLISLGGDFSSDVFHHCGDIYAKCGDIEQAVRYWIMAQEAGDESKILAKKIQKRKYYNDAKLRK
jgi:tetratricopeptide (TPR) repeat protein